MTPTERNYSIEKSEMLAIVEACKEWRHYANLPRFLVDKALNWREA